MAKVAYTHKRLTCSLGELGSQNWMMAQVKKAIFEGKKVVRVWNGVGKSRVLAEVIISSQEKLLP